MGLTRSQYNQIMTVYQERRIKNSLRQRARTEEIYLKIPEIREADERIRSLALKNAKGLVRGADADTAELKREIEELKETKKMLLLRAGFPDDYLDMPYDCMYCKDTGYIGAEKCRCFKRLELEFLYDQSGIRDVLKKENFESFNEEVFDDVKPLPGLKSGMTEREYMRAVRNECLKFCDSFGNNEKPGLLFTGPTGTGKTFLLNCISKRILDRGSSVIYMTATELFDLLARAVFRDKENDEQLSDSKDLLFNCDLLSLDDLGTESSSDFINSRLFSLLNYRMIHRRSTLISTNLSMKDIRDLYTDRIASRIMKDYTVIPFLGRDLRLQGGKNGR